MANDYISQVEVKGETYDLRVSTDDSTYTAMIDGTNTTRIFRSWWAAQGESEESRYEKLCHFARVLAAAWGDKRYTLRYVDPATSGVSTMTPLEDLAEMSAGQLCTDAATPVADWTDEDPLGGWYVRANALSLADGTMNVLAVEGVDSGFDVTGELAPVYTFCPALWRRRWESGGYCFKSWALSNPGGFEPYPGDVDPENKKRDITWRPTFPGGYDGSGHLGSGYGQKPFVRKSANEGIQSARQVSPYEGLWNDADTEWALDMWQLRHFDLENSNICNGCQSYNFTYTAAVSETGVKRVLVTEAQAANLQVGSNVCIGTGTDRNAAAGHAIADCAKILSKEAVTVEGTDYVAINLDVSSTFDTTAETTAIMTMPWDSGNTENLPGHKDGACHSLTAGHNPMRVMGVELMSGAYDVGLDPLYNVTNFSNSHGDYEVFECRNSEKLAGSITSDYKSTGITLKSVASGWNYVKAFFKTSFAVLFPSTFGGSSTTYFKSAFYGAHSAGVRCPWRFGNLNNGDNAGLAYENGNNAPSNVNWNGRPRLFYNKGG